MMLITHFRSLLRLRMSGAVALLPLHSLISWIGTTLPYLCNFYIKLFSLSYILAMVFVMYDILHCCKGMRSLNLLECKVF